MEPAVAFRYWSELEVDRAVEEKYCKKNSEGSQTIINGLLMNMLSDIGGLRTRKIAKKTLKSEETKL